MPHLTTYLKLIAVSIAWGGTFIATKIASQYTTPFEGAFLRFCFALVGFIVLVFMILPREFRPQFAFRKLFSTIWLAVTGIILYNYCFFRALKIIPASKASLLVSLNPIMVLVASTVIFGDKLPGTKILGALTALCGAVTVILKGAPLINFFSEIGIGELYALGCPTLWAAYTLISRKLGQHQTPLESTFYCCIIGVTGLLPLAFLEGINLSTIAMEGWVSLAYLGIAGTTLGFYWYNQGIQQIGSSRTAIFNNLVPVFAVLLAVTVLKEKIELSTILGGILVILGVTLMNLEAINKINKKALA